MYNFLMLFIWLLFFLLQAAPATRSQKHPAPQPFVQARAGEPEPVGAGCFWLLGAGAA